MSFEGLDRDAMICIACIAGEYVARHSYPHVQRDSVPSAMSRPADASITCACTRPRHATRRFRPHSWLTFPSHDMSGMGGMVVHVCIRRSRSKTLSVTGCDFVWSLHGIGPRKAIHAVTRAWRTAGAPRDVGSIFDLVAEMGRVRANKHNTETHIANTRRRVIDAFDAYR